MNKKQICQNCKIYKVVDYLNKLEYINNKKIKVHNKYKKYYIK